MCGFRGLCGTPPRQRRALTARVVAEPRQGVPLKIGTPDPDLGVNNDLDIGGSAVRYAAERLPASLDRLSDSLMEVETYLTSITSGL
ncbi:hypothetical protein GCM10009836_43780 [Pseudonocardia ailaonensis]|uniref:Uncharacterized protein n=1 Tax=Pseudonocardia ailaonensis TaxID=367279 RepID=A0ABN2NAM5_9PSEU